MEKSYGTHIRVRDDNDYDYDVEAFIESIQKDFKVEFTTLPEWKTLVKRLYAPRIDLKRRIQYANLQKANIIEKVYKQCRPTTFQLFDLGLMPNAWRQNKQLKPISPSPSIHTEETLKKPSSQVIAEPEISSDVIGEPHPNTVTSSAYPVDYHSSKADTTPLNDTDIDKFSIGLPAFIVTNTHKKISPISSNTDQLSCHYVLKESEEVEGEQSMDLESPRRLIICNPATLKIEVNSTEQQSLQFTLTNCTANFLDIRYKHVVDESLFSKTKLLPVIPKRLYPGIPFVFKFIFKVKSENEFKTALYFRIGHNVYNGAPTEPFFVPVCCAEVIKWNVVIPDIITVPSVYSWHVLLGRGCTFPSGVAKLFIDCIKPLHLHINKLEVDLAKENELSIMPSAPKTASMELRESFIQSDIILSARRSSKHSSHKLKTSKSVAADISEHHLSQSELLSKMIYEDILELALDTFVFDRTYVYLPSKSIVKIPVYFTKVERIGFHQSFYIFKVTDSETEIVILEKIVQVLTEVLPHPIKIEPMFMDMTQSMISQGFYADKFIVTNIHDTVPVTVRIKLTTKMKKLFTIKPMISLVPALSSTPFKISLCARNNVPTNEPQDAVYFIFKIILTGCETVYKNVPPIFYELFVPCVADFKRLYNKNYFDGSD